MARNFEMFRDYFVIFEPVLKCVIQKKLQVASSNCLKTRVEFRSQTNKIPYIYQSELGPLGITHSPTLLGATTHQIELGVHSKSLPTNIRYCNPLTC